MIKLKNNYKSGPINWQNLKVLLISENEDKVILCLSADFILTDQSEWPVQQTLLCHVSNTVW